MSSLSEPKILQFAAVVKYDSLIRMGVEQQKTLYPAFCTRLLTTFQLQNHAVLEWLLTSQEENTGKMKGLSYGGSAHALRYFTLLTINMAPGAKHPSTLRKNKNGSLFFLLDI